MAQVDDWEDVSDQADDWQDVSESKDDGFDLGTANRGFADSATLGYGSQLRAAAEPVVFKALNFLTGNDVETDDVFDSEAYLRRRDADIKETERLREENPGSYYTGMGAGAVATAALPGLSAAKGATAGARIANAAKTGAAMGAISNPGDVEGEFSGLQLGDRFKNTLIGGTVGAVFQGAGEGVSKIAQAAPKAIKSFANEKAVKAAGAMKGDMKRLHSLGKVDELGDMLLEDGIVTATATPKTVANRISERAASAMDDVKGYISQADDLLNRPEGFNLENATADQIKAAVRGQGISTSDIKNSLIDDIRKSFPGVPEEELAPAFQKIETWFANRPENMSAQDFQNLKVGLNNFLKKSDYYKDMPGLAKEGLLAVRRGAKEAIENKGNAAAEILGDATGKIKDTNRKLGNLLEIQDLAEDAIGRNAANRGFSLTDYLAGVGGGGIGATVLGGPMAIATAVGSAGANKIARTYGNQVMATSANAVAKQLMKVSPRFAEMAKTNPQAFALMVQNIAQNPKFQEKDPSSQPGQKTPLLDRLSQDPNKVNYLQNDRLKEQLRNQMEQRKFKEKVPLEEAQSNFIQGN